MIIYTADVRCDYWSGVAADPPCLEWTPGLATLALVPTTADARSVARAAGFVKAIASSRREYDLCFDHALDVPGETFPDWKAQG